MGKDIKNIIIWIFLTIMSLGIVNCFVNIPIDYDVETTTEERDYIVNKRTLKIHINTCPSVARMSNKNKLQVNNSLDNLLLNGYYVCNKCKAGVKRKHEHIASTLENIENILFGNDDLINGTYEDYLKSIDNVGKWYVDHIATYEGEYDDISTNAAKEYYKNADVVKKGRILCYPCELLESCRGDYTYAGDDCVRFVFSCFNNFDNNFINLLSKFSKYKWSNINSANLNNKHDRLQYAFYNIGFEIYDVRPRKVDINGDNYFDFEILPINENFILQKGDILSRDGHVHIYIDDKSNFGWGKVNSSYPQYTNTYINTINHNIICSGEQFTRVYRYIGEK